MPIPLGEFGKYLVAGLGTLSEEELQQFPNAGMLANADQSNLEGTIDRLLVRWKLSQRVDVMVKGIQAANLTRDRKRGEWGRMLLHFYYENMSQGTDPHGILDPFNRSLIRDIEEDYAQRTNLLSELAHELDYAREGLETILQNPRITNFSREFVTMEGLMWFVKKEDIAEFLKAAVSIVDKITQIGTLSEILEKILGQTILKEELPQISENIRNNPNISTALREYHSKNTSNLYFYRGDKITDGQISEVVWRSVQIFIEEKGYVLLESLVRSAIFKKLKPNQREELYNSLINDKTLNKHTEVFKDAREGTLVYVSPSELEFVNDYIQHVVKEYTRPEREKIRLQRERQKVLLGGLIYNWKNINYEAAQKIAVELNSTGYNHWSLDLLLASISLKELSNAEPTAETKRKLRRQLGPTIDSYIVSLAKHGRIPSEMYIIIEQDLQALRDFASRTQNAWGGDEGDVVYIRQRANRLADAVRTPNLLETIFAYVTKPFTRDHQLEMVRRAIKTQG